MITLFSFIMLNSFQLKRRYYLQSLINYFYRSYLIVLKSFIVHIFHSNLLASVIAVFLFIEVYHLFIVVSMPTFIIVILFSLMLLVSLFTFTSS